ncbi:MAG: hypothetical protein A3H48_03985 [Candidatus Rokubacteria bacterium RIFCSPLOWO2_02_FULL_71_18]|nr:MAG: hypothetical protein A3H48_03985 [Candidatus Rokubacteria bacterium RIFCSPLOWO2_02_FULL_71_18]
MALAGRASALLLPLALGLDVPPALAARLEGTVVRVVDGDTIHVKVGERVEKVRYIGVNTPEVHHPTKGEEPGGREAACVNRDLVAGRQVRLELDAQTHDRYGRVLAYVWVDGAMINAELVRLGYAQVMTIPPNVRHQALFLRLQREARAAERGLWGRAPALTEGRACK